MKKMITMLWIALFSLGMAKVANAGSNHDVGSVIGGIAGGLIGNNIGHGSGKTVATIGGAVVGSVVGGQVGRNMDYDPYHYHHYTEINRDCYYYDDCAPKYHHTFIGRNGRLCRRFAYEDEFGDKIYGTACCFSMSSGGRCLKWRIIS